MHPCQENWASLTISQDGNLSAVAVTNLANNVTRKLEGLGNLHPAEEAALRLAEGPTSLESINAMSQFTIAGGQRPSLAEMFAAEAKIAHIKTDSLTSIYWYTALDYLRTHYPLTVLTNDDTKVLAPLADRLTLSQSQIAAECFQLEQDVAEFEALYTLGKAKMSQLSLWLDKLRVKLWYKMEVVSSSAYEDARNVATALNNMALATMRGITPGQERPVSPARSRPSTSGASTSSLFDQPRNDTMTILKAPVEHGGPRKLSDPQIDLTKKWLERYHVDNFCKGEERIHRFCMEVKIATRKLVGETMNESPVLWSSDLFSREKNLYDVHAVTAFSAQPSTRAPSVWSEPLTSNSIPFRAGFSAPRSLFNSGSSRLGRDMVGSDLASVISSPGRATTSTTLETASSIWSPAQSNSRSVTSVSLQSRPASTFEDIGLNRLIDHGPEKARFLENLQQDLTALLLSDLGCPVWSRGSETDSWMDAVRQTPSIIDRLEQRAVMARLLSRTPPPGSRSPSESRTGRKQKHRSLSVDHSRDRSLIHGPELTSTERLLGSGDLPYASEDFSYVGAFNDILSRVRDHVDPNMKLKALHDFQCLSQAFQPSQQESQIRVTTGRQAAGSAQPPRRRSLNPSILSANLGRREGQEPTVSPISGDDSESKEHNQVQYLKTLLFVLGPKTIFRDLQYIAAFVSSHTLDDTELGRAFLHVGLAALAWKDEVCRGMVDVADRIVAKDAIKREMRRGGPNEPSVLKALEYWMIAAREGNAIAQRELASVYLTHPEVPPIVSLPLAFSSEIFKSEMKWREEEGSRRHSHALCLALHWMQQAADNGDVVAQTKLKERQSSRFIR